MDKKKILILGGSGLVGVPLTKMLEKKYIVFTTYHNKKFNNESIKLDLLNSNSIERIFQLSNPDVVINLFGMYKNLDFCEKNKKLVMKINGLSLKPISKLSNKFNSFLVSLSSDYVFDGRTGNYKEYDKVCPINYYGKSRAEGEKNIQKIASNYCIVRTSMVYGKSTVRKTLPDLILSGIKQKKGLKLVYDQYMTPTYLENLCKMLVEIIKLDYRGIIHLAGREKVSRYDFAIKLFNIFGLEKDNLIPVKTTEFSFGSKMPKDSSLNTEKASTMLKEKPELIETSIRKYLKQMKKHLDT